MSQNRSAVGTAAVERSTSLRGVRYSTLPALTPEGMPHRESQGGIAYRAIGARWLILLPGYSPDLNPIEEAFSFIRAWLQRQEFLYTGPNRSNQLPSSIHGEICEITPATA